MKEESRTHGYLVPRGSREMVREVTRRERLSREKVGGGVVSRYTLSDAALARVHTEWCS